MAACPSCGADNPERARFCLDCGARMGDTGRHPDESRRIVTVLFSDLVGSTALGERLDAETVRGIMARYFGAMEAAIAHHGGIVEKFIGDAIMAVFGLPTLHEDDALRAVRAAVEMRRALATLNAQLDTERGVTIAARTGINTGEVVAGLGSDQKTLVTGDPVNTAARLEQAAGSGEILIGAATWRLVRPMATAEAMPAVAAKGKAEPVTAFRLLSLADSVKDSPPGDTRPLLGRETELEELRQAFVQARRERRPILVTILGLAGVGKSRLTSEFVEWLGPRARVLRGRCLSYGEGLTYWPLREVLQAAAEIRDGDTAAESLAKVTALTGEGARGAVMAERLASAIGLAAIPASAEEIFWATRRTLERIAADGPLVLVFEDIHWAQPTFLELLEHIVDRGGSAPLLILCPSRLELLESNPGWMADRPNARSIRLDGISAEAAQALIEAVPGGDAVPAALRERILAIAEGNPLFVEEMVRLILDGEMLSARTAGQAAAAVEIPPTIQALMASRVDQLPRPERSVAQRGSVVGRVFETSAVTALTPPPARADVATHLLALARRELLRPEDGDAADGAAYKFRHILIRDAAYEALPKAERTQLHEAFATWLEDGLGDRIDEYQEILGHHLEQSFRYRAELREGGEDARQVGLRARVYLEAAARRAYELGDVAASAQLCQRTEGLPEASRAERADLLVQWSLALVGGGRLADALVRAEEALSLAIEIADPRLAARARLLRLEIWANSGVVVLPSEAAAAEVEAALADAKSSRDPRALAEAWQYRGNLTYLWGRLDESAAETRIALEHAERTGNARFLLENELNALTEAVVGATPATEVVAMAQRILDRAAAYPTIRADALRLLSVPEAMLGHIEDARRHIDECIAIMEDLGQVPGTISGQLDKSWVERSAGDLPAAERVLRNALVDIERLGDQTVLSFGSSRLAVVLVAEGRLDEVGPYIEEADRVASVTNRTRMIGARARIHAAAGDPSARSEIDELLELVRDSGFINVRTDALIDAAEAMASLGDWVVAAGHQRRALDLAKQKENLVLARQLEARLAEMESASAAAARSIR